MHLIRKYKNTIIGAGILILAGILYCLIPSQIAMIETSKEYARPSFYPRIIIVLMAIIALVYIVTSAIQEHKQDASSSTPAVSDEETSDHSAWRTLLTVIIMAAYISLISVVGFFIATPFGLAALMLHMGNRRPVALIGTCVIAPIVIYLIFEKLLMIYLPRGIF
jgi:putative tricarboxylic transport membrane protein